MTDRPTPARGRERGLFALLDADWARLERSPAMRRAWRRWRLAEPALRPAAAVADLVVENRARRGREADPVLLPLVRFAGDDVMAGRVVLQLLLPGVVRLAGRVRWLLGEDAAAAAVAATWERIRTYPVDRRPHAVAANVLLDARKTLWTCHRPVVPMEPTDPSRLRAARWSDADPHPSSQVAALLAAALAEEVLDAAAVDLLARRYLADATAEELAACHHTHPDTVRRRWRKAEAALRAAVA